MPQGPLKGLKVLEFAGLGPAPFCAMLFSDLGADVLRIDRPDEGAQPYDVTARGRRSLALDLKAPGAADACLALAAKADVLIEGFRPGVMERLGIGPEPALARNPRLVYGRMTGWGQEGPLSDAAGHDIGYIALAGALHAIGPLERPAPPLNLVGDYGGGALYLAFGVLAAVLHARATGEGQVVDCAVVDGAASLMGLFYGLKAHGLWRDERETNLLDGAAPFYGTYRCADGKWLAVGALEPKFYAAFMQGLELPLEPERQMDRAAWPVLRTRIAEVIATRTRDAWCALFDGLDACVAPVLDLDEAPNHPHNRRRSTFVEQDGVVQPGPAPRFSGTPGAIQGPVTRAGQGGKEAVADWGLSETDAAAVRALAASPR